GACDQQDHHPILRRQLELLGQSGRRFRVHRRAAGRSTTDARMKNDAPLIYLVDDDDAVRDSLGLLFKSIGLAYESYASALDFLEHYDPQRHACLVADIRMPGL